MAVIEPEKARRDEGNREHWQKQDTHSLVYCLDHLLSCLSILGNETSNSLLSNLNLTQLDAKSSLITARIRHLRNASSFAVRAPPEVLGIIFKFLQDLLVEEAGEEHESVGTSSRIRSYRLFFRWLRVARVCQHWRYASENLPFLWNKIIVTEDYLSPTESGLSPLQICLQRSLSSGSLQVHIHWNPSNTHDTSQLSQILSHLPRMQYLHFVGAFCVQPAELFGVDAARLKVLSLDMPQSIKTQSYHISRALHALCANNLPLLRSLALSEFRTYPKINAHSLKQLQLQATYETTDHFQSLLALLRGLSVLEDLMFLNSQFPVTQDNSLFETHVDLANLKRLAFGSCANARMLLSSVQLPTGVYLTWWNTPVAGILPTDISRLENLQDLSSCTLAYPPERGGDCLISAIGSSSALRGQCWNYYGPQDPALDLSAMMCNIDSLYVTGVIQVHTNSHTLLKIFRELPNLRQLILCLEDLHSTLLWIDALALNETPCRLLRGLHLHVPSDKHLASLPSMTKALQVRQDRGYPLQTIKYYVFSTEGPHADQESERLQAIRSSMGVLESYVTEKVELVSDACPAMDTLPEICYSQSGEAWRWPCWDDDPWKGPKLGAG